MRDAHERDDADETDETPTDGAAARWDATPTTKARAAVQRAVDALLDALAPQRTVTRGADRPVAIERYRTRHGCILQAPTAAVSVSWFPDASRDGVTGELHVAAWRGVLSQPGSARRVAGATVVRELVLRPVDRGTDAWAWSDPDGATHDTRSVAALCLGFLEARVDATAE